ncbi:MAG TPA: hypothetical protein VLA96_09360 [Terriglobales bacterium]|nr:hypothetical protein [Terriglobales bacterium]
MAKKTKSKSAPKSRPATHLDADLMLRTYEQRRDQKLRDARNFILFQWTPTTDEEFASLAFNFGTQEQTYFRMVFSYWEQTAALADRGIVHPDLFDDFSGELFFLYAKYGSFFPIMRERMSPLFGQHIERVANATAERRARVERARRMIASRRAQPAKAAAQ